MKGRTMKKVTSLVLASAIAFTPVLSPVLPFLDKSVGATEVENLNVATLAHKFYNTFYHYIPETDSTLDTAAGNINSVDFNKVIPTEMNLTDSEKIAFEKITKGIAKIIYTNHKSADELKTEIIKFKSESTSYFDTLFNNVTASHLLEFFSELEDNIFIIAAALSTSDDSDTNGDILETIVRLIIAENPNLQVLETELSDYGIGVADLFTIQSNLNALIDLDKTARSTLIKSVVDSKKITITPQSDLKPGKNVEFELNVPGVGSFGELFDWEVIGSGATFDGNVLNITSAGTYIVSAKLKGENLTVASTQITVSSNTGGGGGDGGDGGTTPPTDGEVIEVDNDTVTVEKGTNDAGKTEVTVTVNPDKLGQAFENAEQVDTVSIKVEKEAGEVAVVKLPSKAFDVVKEKNPNAVVKIESTEGTYKLPVKEINLDAIATDFGLSTKDDLTVSIEIFETEDEDNVLEGKNLNAVSKVVEFKITVTAGDKNKEVKQFSSYVERSIVSDSEFNAANSTAVKINEDGSVTPVPTIFNGKVAIFKSLTNSKYTIIENDVTFDDVSTTHWAKEHINKLASKLIIRGKDVGEFDPEGSTTRVEFAILLVRSLGLTNSESYDNQFRDVKGNEWYINDLMAAVEAGLIKGLPGEKLAPSDSVTREQAAAMIQRAMEFVGYDESKLDATKKLSSYNDKAEIATWSQKSVESMLQAKIMGGKPGGNFDPTGDTTRAEIAKILDQMLKFVSLID